MVSIGKRGYLSEWKEEILLPMIDIHVNANPLAFLDLLHYLGLDFLELKLLDALLELGYLDLIDLLGYIH